MKAMGVAVKAATEFDGIKWITAVNFDGKLGKYQMSLKESVESA
jgi:formylmethanofuran:tetrahydromethanopterin formyltransferase